MKIKPILHQIVVKRPIRPWSHVQVFIILFYNIFLLIMFRFEKTKKGYADESGSPVVIY